MLEFHKPSGYSSVCVSDDSNPKSIIFTQYFPCREENVNTLSTISFQNIWIWFCHVMINSLCKLVVAVTRVITWVCGDDGEGGGLYCLRPRMLWSVGYGGWAGTEVTCKSVWTSAKTIVFRSNMHNNPLSLSPLSCAFVVVVRRFPGSPRDKCLSHGSAFVRPQTGSFVWFIIYTAFFTPCLSVISN